MLCPLTDQAHDLPLTRRELFEPQALLGLPDGQQWFLQKPFSPDQLLSTVRAALDAPVQSGIAPEAPRI